TWIDRVRQPRVRRPCPPKRGQEQERVLEAAPGRIAGQHRCDLRERKDEDEVEKELERRDPLLALDGLRVHERTLTRFAGCVRPRSGYRGAPRELVPAVLLDDRFTASALGRCSLQSSRSSITYLPVLISPELVGERDDSYLLT